MADYIKHYLDVLGVDIGHKDLALVQKMQERHLKLFNFSSINVLLDKDLPLDSESLFERLIVGKEGGYCFEHNKIFYEVLDYLGFKVHAVLGRVLNNHIRPVAQTHRATILEFGGKGYLVDVGFGPHSPHLPVRITGESTKTQRGKVYRITQNDHTFFLEEKHKDHYVTHYSFTLFEAFDPDFEVAHFYSHKHHDANFVKHLIVSRILEDRTYFLRHDSLHIIGPDRTEIIHIDCVNKLQGILKNYFEVNLESKLLERLYKRIEKQV